MIKRASDERRDLTEVELTQVLAKKQAADELAESEAKRLRELFGKE